MFIQPVSPRRGIGPAPFLKSVICADETVRFSELLHRDRERLRPAILPGERSLSAGITARFGGGLRGNIEHHRGTVKHVGQMPSPERHYDDMARLACLVEQIGLTAPRIASHDHENASGQHFEGLQLTGKVPVPGGTEWLTVG